MVWRIWCSYMRREKGSEGGKGGLHFDDAVVGTYV
jgi:hypothetical protein